MGTRSLTVVRDGDAEIVCIYRQFDGYLDGMGSDIAGFARGMVVVNGLGGGQERVANGMGCFAAQLVAKLKDKPGNVYLYAPGTRDCGEEYLYTLSEREGRVWMVVQVGPMTAFGEHSGVSLGEQGVLWQGRADDFVCDDVVELENTYWETR